MLSRRAGWNGRRVERPGRRNPESRACADEEAPRSAPCLVNAALVALAFGLLGLVIWKNRGQIHEIFSRKLDLRLIALAFAVYFTSLR